jgi:hypothetical protein
MPLLFLCLIITLLIELLIVDGNGSVLSLNGCASYSVFVATLVSRVGTGLLSFIPDIKWWQVCLVRIFALTSRA